MNDNQATALTVIQEMANDKRAAGRYNNARINKELKFRQECHYALEIVQGNKKLQQCTPQSVRTCIEDTALLGLTLKPALAHAYLVPRYLKKQGVMICTLYTSWRGLKVAAQKWGGLLDMTAQVVYANEPFKMTAGTNPSVEHTIISNHAARGPIIGAYCVAYMRSGITLVEYMDRDQIERARAVSEAKDSQFSPWINWPEEQSRKTVVRRAAKHWQGHPEMQSSLGIQNKYEGLGEAVDDEEDSVIVGELVSEDDTLAIHAMLTDNGCDADKVIGRICRVMGLETLEQMTSNRLPEAKDYAQMAIAAKQKQ
jgi:recombination protein RecT